LDLTSAMGTIFFVHSGPLQPYAQAAVLQARVVNPQSQIVVLGDQSPSSIPRSVSRQIQYESLKHHSARAVDFSKIFRFEGNNSYEYELLNFQRWFYIREFCETNSLEGPFLLLDSDAYLYLSIHEVVPSLQSPMTVVDRVGPQFTFFINLDAVTQFTDFVTESFSSNSGFERLSNFVDEWVDNGLPHVSDMATLGSYAREHRLEDLGTADRLNFIFCENVGSSQGLAMSLLGKKVTVRGKRRFFTTKDGRKVLAGGIHLQGGNKALWPYFVDKSVRRAIRNFSRRNYRAERAHARRKAFGIGLRKISNRMRHAVPYFAYPSK